MIDEAVRGRASRGKRDLDRLDRDKHVKVRADREPRDSVADVVPRTQASREASVPNLPRMSERESVWVAAS